MTSDLYKFSLGGQVIDYKVKYFGKLLDFIRELLYNTRIKQLNNEQTMPKPKLLDVKIVTEDDGGYLVQPVWADVDRPISGGYCCGKNRSLAERLYRAMKAGPVFSETTLKTDCNGKTYISANLVIRMRCANADLNRIGY